MDTVKCADCGTEMKEGEPHCGTCKETMSCGQGTCSCNGCSCSMTEGEAKCDACLEK